MTLAPAVGEGLEEAVLGSLLLAFEGTELPDSIARRLAGAPAAGVTLFRPFNVRDPGQVRELTDSLQRAAGQTLLVAADQEGGQLLAFGEPVTPFAGNMALGAAGDDELAERVGRAIGLELRAMGVNVAYGPVCDVATNSLNPALGIRSFGDDPDAVGRLAAAMIRGLSSAGVAATAKHFPGLGDLADDSHHRLGTVAAGESRERFDQVELVPFRAAIAAGARLVMSAHVAAPSLTDDPTLPATLAPSIMTDLLRDTLGFDGVSVTDALDMDALAQGPAQIVDVIAALRAGVDLLLTAADDEARERIEIGLRQAARRGLVDRTAVRQTGLRLAALRSWLAAGPDVEPSEVGSTAHRELARELADCSVTLVRNERGLLPLRLAADAMVGVIQPVPRDLTPADTSSYVGPTLAAAVARRHPRLNAYLTGHPPSDAEIGALRMRATEHDLLIVGTISASLDPAQAALVNELEATGVPLITVALRTPWDLSAYPVSSTHACSYGILPPTVEALADALWGAIPFQGHLPVALGNLYPRGHGLTT